MLLTISTTYQPATDLGYLLHKHPDKAQTFSLNFGKAHVFYPEATSERCTAALLLDIDPVGLIRGGKDVGVFQYVNDRPFAASSFLTVAIGQVFRSAMAGNCKGHEDLVAQALPLSLKIASLPLRANEEQLEKLFTPLGYEVAFDRGLLDESFPEWGISPYGVLTLTGTLRLAESLNHLCVLIPVLDKSKHYFVGDDEVEKLLRRGEGWLKDHPEKEYIVYHSLKRKRSLAKEALSRLVPEEESQEESEGKIQKEEVLERPLSLNEQRQATVLGALRHYGARTVIDLGCGEGKFLPTLLKEPSFQKIVGMDVSSQALGRAAERLHLDRMGEFQRQKIDLWQGSLMYRDKRLSGFDAASIVEVIEHMDEPRLSAFERVVFEFARPRIVVVTTPNFEFNVKFENLEPGKFRHDDHRFEWTREQFQSWAMKIAERFGYTVQFAPIGTEENEVGPPTQMGVFQLV